MERSVINHNPYLYPMHILPSVYMGNIFYWSMIATQKNSCVDEGEFFVKQTYRNRAEICSEKGITPLIIPLEKGKNSKQHMLDVRVSYAENWQALHYKTICSAYGKAAYFEHYRPELEILFSKRPSFLCEWNRLWLDFFSTEFELPLHAVFYSSTYVEAKNEDNDLRVMMDPKIDIHFQHQAYYNLFFDKFPQPQNLSVIDLLMNEGPRGRAVLLHRK